MYVYVYIYMYIDTLINKIYTAQHKKMQNGPHHLGMVEHITSQLKKSN